MNSLAETLFATLVFWFSFEFSFSSFWVGIMEISRTTALKKVLWDYTLFMLAGFLPLVVVICIVVAYLGGINQTFFILWHFFGAGVIFYLAYKTFVAKVDKSQIFKYGVKEMCLANWSNPKIYLLVPSGFLASQFSSSTTLNIAIFYWVGFPICIAGMIFWYYVGKIGVKFFIHKLSYFNATLLAGFAVYLLYNAFELIQTQSI